VIEVKKWSEVPSEWFSKL